MFIIVKKNRIHDTGAESATSKTYTDYDVALRDFYNHLSANVVDQSVERFDIAILGDTLIPCKTEHYERKYTTEE